MAVCACIINLSLYHMKPLSVDFGVRPPHNMGAVSHDTHCCPTENTMRRHIMTHGAFSQRQMGKTCFVLRKHILYSVPLFQSCKPVYLC